MLFRSRQARQLLGETFGEESKAWEQRLGLSSEPTDAAGNAVASGPFDPTRPAVEPQSSPWSLDRAIDLDAALGTSDPTQPRDQSAPPVDPEDPHSAVLGRSL